MATKLRIVFNTASGTVTHNYSYVNPGASAANVQALANGIVTNGVIYSQQPLSVKSATIITTTETSIPLS